MEDIIFGKNAVTEALIAGDREINKILISKSIHTDSKISPSTTAPVFSVPSKYPLFKDKNILIAIAGPTNKYASLWPPSQSNLVQTKSYNNTFIINKIMA